MRSWAWACSPTRGTERAVLAVLADRAGPAGLAWPSMSDLAERSGYGRSAVARSLASLESAGVIARVPADFAKQMGARRHGRSKNGQHTVIYRFDDSLCRHPHDEQPDDCTHVADVEGVSERDTLVFSSGTSSTVVPESKVSSSATQGVPLRAEGVPEKDTEQNEPKEPTPAPLADELAVAPHNSGGEADEQKEPLPVVASELRSALTGHGIPDAEQAAVLAIAQADPETDSPAGRLKASGHYARLCQDQARAERRETFAAGTKCEEHGTEVAANCRPCQSERKAGERPAE